MIFSSSPVVLNTLALWTDEQHRAPLQTRLGPGDPSQPPPAPANIGPWGFGTPLLPSPPPPMPGLGCSAQRHPCSALHGIRHQIQHAGPRVLYGPGHLIAGKQCYCSPTAKVLDQWGAPRARWQHCRLDVTRGPEVEHPDLVCIALACKCQSKASFPMIVILFTRPSFSKSTYVVREEKKRERENVMKGSDPKPKSMTAFL